MVQSWIYHKKREILWTFFDSVLKMTYFDAWRGFSSFGCTTVVRSYFLVISVQICIHYTYRYVVQLPGKTPEGYDVYLSKLNRTDPKYFEGPATMKLYNMLGDVCYKKNGVSSGILQVVDIDGSSLSHVMKHNITCLRHSFIYLQVRNISRIIDRIFL